MKFYEVQKALEEGKKIKRSSWIGSYLYFKDGRFYREFDCQGSERYPIKDSDVLFDDWEIVEDALDFKSIFIELSIHPPDIITIVAENGTKIRYLKE